MNQQVTKAIVLSRTDFGEADRIITVLTPDMGKIRLMAKGVRKINSKLAGGVELFSISDITFISGRGEVKTLVSSRLIRHYGKIVGNIDRVQLGYEIIKLLNKATEDNPESGYFDLLNSALNALDDFSVSSSLIDYWLKAQLLKLGGHMPNLISDTTGAQLDPGSLYNFDVDAMTFTKHPHGNYTPDDIKVLRLIFSGSPLKSLSRIAGIIEVLNSTSKLVNTMLRTYVY